MGKKGRNLIANIFGSQEEGSKRGGMVKLNYVFIFIIFKNVTL
jgi:hypothetical protein